jgi:hypothetical protein
MIDRTQLTEALADVRDLADGSEPPSLHALAAAARLLLDFPTDEQVEAAARGMWPSPAKPNANGLKQARAALEAVRQTMIGEED